MSTTRTTESLKRELWARFGDEAHPAEWDGRTLGGGKLSQRFWEYFKAIELLQLDGASVVVDIGGGSPDTGLGFFSSLLATAVKEVIVMDPHVREDHAIPPNVHILRTCGGYDTLREMFARFPAVTHVTSISVWEHIAPDIRDGIFRALNEFFPGERFVTTFEYHPTRRFFQHQLTAQSVSEMVAPLTSFYLTAFEASPVLGEDPRLLPPHEPAPRLLARRLVRRVVGHVPKWFPVALAFDRARPGL